MKRAAIGLLFVILLATPGLALGKVPWSSVEIVPAEPVAGEPLTVVVRFWDGAARTRPSTWWPDPATGASPAFEGPAGRALVTLTRTGAGTYRAEVTLTEGTWRLVVDQHFADASGPTEVELATVTVAAAPAAAAPFGAAVVGVALATLAVIWRGRRSPEPREAG